MAERIYDNGDIKVLWQSDLCTHCETCYKGLPQVFNPSLRPWVNVNAATTEEIVRQVGECPSGALSILKEEGGPWLQ